MVNPQMPSTDWGINAGYMADTAPLGLDVQQFIMEYCTWLLYFRKDDRFFCPQHWDQASASNKDYLSFCDICYGFGFKTDPIVVPCRISFQDTINVSARSSEERQNSGYLQYFTAAAYFPRSIMPKLEDVVIACEWDKPMQIVGNYPKAKAIRTTNIWQIKQIMNPYERELAFFACGLEAADDLTSKMNINIPQLQNIPVFNPVGTWAQEHFWDSLVPSEYQN